MTAVPGFSIWVVAFAGESARLAATLQQIPSTLHHAVTVLAADDPALRVQLPDSAANHSALRLKTELPDSCPQHAFWTTLIPLLDEAHGPCMVIRAGTLLPAHWAGRLLSALTPRNVAVFPLSVRYPCTTVFDNAKHQPGLPVQAIDDWLNDYAAGYVFDLPCLSGQSALLKPSHCAGVLADSAIKDDVALARALIDAGLSIVGSDALYVDDSVLPPQSLPEDLYEAWRDAHERHPLMTVRHGLTQLSSRCERPPADLPSAQPVCLHICHGWGGGLWRWVEDVMAVDSGRKDGARHLVLRPIGDRTAFCQTLALFDTMNGAPLASWTLARPILSTVISHDEYEQVLSQIIADYGVSQLMVSSVIGHALHVLETGLPTIVICHDFYPVCPPILASWHSPCTTCNDERLRNCLVQNPAHRFFEFETAPHWKNLRAAYVKAVAANQIPMVAPSPSVAERWRLLAPHLRSHDLTVIPHGLPQQLIDAAAPMRDLVNHLPGERLRILVLGGLGEHKGSDLLQGIITDLSEFADLLLLGCGDAGDGFQGKKGISCIPRYAREELGGLLATHAPDVGLLLSTVPETFSYTLSELHAAGIPVAATALGAFADRITPDENGWLFQPDSEALLALMRELQAQPGRITAARTRLCAGHPRNAVEMLEDYESLLARRFTAGPVYRPGKKGRRVPREAVGAVHVSPDATYREALRSFLSYTKSKLRGTHRLPRFVRRLLAALLR